MIRVTRVLGLDPGPGWTGWCLLESAVPRARFLDGGKTKSDRVELEALIVRSAPTLVAVETVEGYAHEHWRSAQLIATSRVAGWIEQIASQRGHALVSMPAAKWRRALVGRVNPDDATIARAFEIFVTDRPARSNAHVRDAAGLAIVAMRMPRAVPLAKP